LFVSRVLLVREGPPAPLDQSDPLADRAPKGLLETPEKKEFL